MMNFIQQNKVSLNYYLLSTVGMLFCFSNQLQATLIIVIFGFLFFINITEIKNITKREIALWALISAPFTFIVLDFFYTPFTQWILLKSFYETRLFILFAPIVLLLVKKTKKEISQNVFLGFVISIFALSIYIFVSANWLKLFDSGNFNQFQFNLRTHAESICGIHPTYFSMYLVFAISLMLLFSFFENKFFQTLFLFVFCLTLLLIGAKIALLSVFPLFLLLLISKNNSNQKHILFIGVAIILGGISLFFVESRWSELLPKTSTTEPINSVGIRKLIYQTDWELLKEHWFFGLGFLKLKYLMDTSFFQYAFYLNQPIGFYNTHNQYIEFCLQYGISGVLYIMFVVYFLWKNQWEKSSILLKIFLLFIAVFMLTENILDRQQGVLFVYFYLCLLLFFDIEKTKKPAIESL